MDTYYFNVTAVFLLYFLFPLSEPPSVCVCVCKRWMWCDQLVSEASSGAFSPTPSDWSVWEPTFEDGLMSEGHKSWRTESVGCICFLLKYSRLYIKDWCRRCDITHGLAVLKPDVTCRGGGLDWDIWYQLTDSVVMVWIDTEAAACTGRCDVTFVVRCLARRQRPI